MALTNRIFAVDLHACGEPGRVITRGLADVPGKTMFEKKCFLEKNMDGLRLRMLREPRGYPASNCNLLLPPTIPGADGGFVIMEQVEYPPMSGTNTICVVTALLETGIVPANEGCNTLKLDTPAGLVDVQARCEVAKSRKLHFKTFPVLLPTWMRQLRSLIWALSAKLQRRPTKTLPPASHAAIANSTPKAASIACITVARR